MVKSTPADLAVAFRSLARRRREAIGDADPASVGGALGELDAQVAAAAGLLGVPPDAAAVAAAITSRPSDAWDREVLDQLRQGALEIGRIVREIAAITSADEDDD